MKTSGRDTGRARSGRRAAPTKASGATARRDGALPDAAKAPAPERRKIERVQTGVRLERRILGVLKALADLHGLSLGDLLEGIVLHAFEGKAPFAGPSLEKIAALRGVFGLDLCAEDSHLLVEKGRAPGARSP
jgi:hypothetical protein